ncbi:arabinofuranosyltransferase AftA domain protein [Mycobacterium xenopi 4042]|uniref:Galactan 5-O-arabinofuranosyltransferase n=1 Tax=Mycobacterium xenopi 4042 TaxID=1299334 RepID=X8DIC8_MYCXE|nr:arabinofuranosyltransferase AftA domain protein [Mycobacterium xenopi 4042]
MLQFTLLGALCMLGTLWLVVRLRSSVRATALAIGVLAVYLWSLLSMLTTLARTTLLSFRLQPTLSVLLAAPGRSASSSSRRPWPGVDATTPGAAASSGGRRGGSGRGDRLQPGHSDVLRPDLTIAYTDTDGHGQRGDRRRPGPRSIPGHRRRDHRNHGRARDEIVVLTADYSFLSYYPYWVFKG